MQIEEVDIDSIIPYENNPRINHAAVRMLVTSIENFGFQIPVILDKDNVLVAGHTRVEAAKVLGMEKVPAIYARDLSPEQVKAFRIMDNRTAEQSTWDYRKLLTEFDDLSLVNWDMDSVGFDLLDIENLRCDLEVTTRTVEPSRVPRDPNNSSHTVSEDDTEDDLLEEEEVNEEPKKPEVKNNMVIQYNIIFNTEDEQKIWFGYLRALKTKYPDMDTISERLIADIADKTIDGLS